MAVLGDAETVPVGTQEVEQVRVPEAILDALAEDLQRPSRRLLLMGGGHQTSAAVEDTVTTQPAEAPLPTWVEVGEEQPSREIRLRRRFVQGRATQVESDADEDMPIARQVVLFSQPEVFPMSDDADVEVAFMAGQAGGRRRVALVPVSPGTPRSIQDRSMGSTGSRFAGSEQDEEVRRGAPFDRVGSERESLEGGGPIGDTSETQSVGSHHEGVGLDSAEEDGVVSEAGEMAEEEAEVEEVPFHLPGVATLRAASGLRGEDRQVGHLA